MKWVVIWGWILGAGAAFSPGFCAWAQTTPFHVTESIRAAQEIARGLNVPDSLAQRLLEAALPFDGCLSHWNALQDSLEASPISEAALLERLTEIRVELGACRDGRKMAMRRVLPDQMKLAFDQLAQPNRPSVLHFGLHNRMECVVCKPQPPESP